MKIQELIKKYGINKVKFEMDCYPLNTTLGISFTSSNDETKRKICYISEERYKLSENYKTTLVPEDKNFAKEDFYMLDLQSLINRGQISVLLMDTDK